MDKRIKPRCTDYEANTITTRACDEDIQTFCSKKIILFEDYDASVKTRESQRVVEALRIFSQQVGWLFCADALSGWLVKVTCHLQQLL